MKKYILLLFIGGYFSGKGISQTHSGYKIFIMYDTSIQWAAESEKIINLTPKPGGFSLKKWYLDKIKNDRLTAYHPGNGWNEPTPYPFSIPSLQKQEWLRGLDAEPSSEKQKWYFVDRTKPLSDYDRLRYRVGERGFSTDSCCGCDEAEAFSARQMITYTNGQFSIWNLFISPLCARMESTSLFAWYPLCYVAYNDNPGRLFPGAGKNVVKLNTDEIDYEFNPGIRPATDSVLSSGNEDIGSRLYQDIVNGKLAAVELATGKTIPADKFLSWGMPSDTMAVYDPSDISKITAYKVVRHERNVSDLSRIRIKQDFYFDSEHERLYSLVRSVVIMIPVRSYDGMLRGYTPFCRLEAR